MSAHPDEKPTGLPGVCKCANCIHWQALDAESTTGFCKQLHLFFAYSLQSAVYGLTHQFFFCPAHLLQNEDWPTQEGRETILAETCRQTLPGQIP